MRFAIDRWNYRWWESIEEDWISPYENSDDDIRFTYWWDDMRPAEVKKLVQDAYKEGYKRGEKELVEIINKYESILAGIQLKALALTKEIGRRN